MPVVYADELIANKSSAVTSLFQISGITATVVSTEQAEATGGPAEKKAGSTLSRLKI